MKLLLDENLSRRLVPSLLADYPGSTQVALAGMERASDEQIWEFAKREGFVIVTKDDNFNALLALHGYPPKVIHLQIGNCANSQITALLHKAKSELERELAHDDVGSVELG